MDNRLHCFNKLEELFSLYDKVRQSVILLENFNEEQKMYIAPINQLRSALDHIFKAINICDDFEQCEYELREAKEHLDRAGYDTMELLAANIGITIVEKLKRYDTKTITEVFPYYFTFFFSFRVENMVIMIYDFFEIRESSRVFKFKIGVNRCSR